MDLMSTAQLLGNFGEFVGAIAVVGSLIYLAIQVKHAKSATERNSEIILAQNYQSRSEAAQKAFISAADSDHLAPLMAKIGSYDPRGFDFGVRLSELTSEERHRIIDYQHYLLLAVDNQHYQYQHGFSDEDYYQSVVIPAIKILAPVWDELGLLSMGRRSSFLSAVQPYIAGEGATQQNE